MNVVWLAHLMFCNVQYKPARFPAFQQRSTFIQDTLVRPEKGKCILAGEAGQHAPQSNINRYVIC